MFPTRLLAPGSGGSAGVRTRGGARIVRAVGLAVRAIVRTAGAAVLRHAHVDAIELDEEQREQPVHRALL
eukprot:1391349-Prymnesium_polylepis.2